MVNYRMPLQAQLSSSLHPFHGIVVQLTASSVRQRPKEISPSQCWSQIQVKGMLPAPRRGQGGWARHRHKQALASPFNESEDKQGLVELRYVTVGCSTSTFPREFLLPALGEGKITSQHRANCSLSFLLDFISRGLLSMLMLVQRDFFFNFCYLLAKKGKMSLLESQTSTGWNNVNCTTQTFLSHLYVHLCVSVWSF